MSSDYVPFAVQVIVPADDDDLDQLGAEPDLDLTAPREMPAPRDLFFDVDAGISIVKSVTAVISGAGGAAKVVDWVLTRLRQRRGKLVVLKVGDTSVTVRVGDDPEEARKLLRAALRII
jgi:hypothetical protein